MSDLMVKSSTIYNRTNCDVGMKLKIIKVNENSENKVTFPEDQKEYDVITQRIQDLTQDIRSFLKDGKITIHSVMTTWVGSPFGAVEAFKKSDINQDEIDTKFSCTIFDVIEIISNLQREDPIAFWVGGKKNIAMKHLVPLATDSVRLCHKLQRITTTLEGYSVSLQKTADALQVLVKKPTTGPPEIECFFKQPKSGNCYRFRRAFRHAWYTLSGYEKKAITEAPPAEDSRRESTERAQSTPKDPVAFILMRNEVRTPERNKSDSAQRNRGCNAFNGFCQCPAYFCQKFDYQPRLRHVPSFIFVPQPIQYHCKHQDCNCNNCSENNPAGDVPQGQCQCQCCQNQQQQQETQAVEKFPDEKAQDPPGNQESQPFEVSTDGYETSYLKDYEKNCLCQKVAEDGNPTKDPSDAKIEPPTEYTDINAIDPDNGNLDSNCNNTEEEVIKEVVIVRSAVSDFAESEYGAIDSEDMEWLEKIKDMGQTGNICAEEIEQSERLKRQSIFLNCIRFRTEETFKDLQSVLKMVRATESKWVDPTESNLATEDTEPGPTDNRRLELKEIVSEIDKNCRRLVPKNCARGKSKVDKSQVEPIGQLVLSIQGEVAGVHKSFQRFTKMVTADANFLKQLCLGFSRRELSLEEELRQNDKPVPNYLCMPIKEGDQSPVEIPPEVDFREIFDGEL